MAGTYVKTKVYNRHFIVNFGTADDPEFYDLIYGFSSRGNNITEDTQDYFYFSDRGTADSDTTTQTIERTFAGNRFLGDPAQDAIFIDRMYDMDKRVVQVFEYYDDKPDSYTEKDLRYNASIVITDDGSGDTASREAIAFALRLQGKPEKGTVGLPATEGDPYTFTPKTVQP